MKHSTHYKRPVRMIVHKAHHHLISDFGDRDVNSILRKIYTKKYFLI